MAVVPERPLAHALLEDPPVQVAAELGEESPAQTPAAVVAGPMARMIAEVEGQSGRVHCQNLEHAVSHSETAIVLSMVSPLKLAQSLE